MTMCSDCRKEANEINGTSFETDGTYLDADEKCGLCGTARDVGGKRCPNCNGRLESFSNVTRSGVHEGYECPDCDVRWTLDEWERGVDKYPDPDPLREVPAPNERLIGHAYRDLFDAVEDGSLTIETPRGQVSQDDLRELDLEVKQDVGQHGGYRTFSTSVGPPYIVIQFTVDDDGEIIDDLRKHAVGKARCVVYGRTHLWDMQESIGRVHIEGEVDGGIAADVEIEWHDVEPIGWT